MKRNKLLISAVSCVFFLLAGCQQEAKMAEGPADAEKPAVKKAGPKIEFESMVYDFGGVGPGQKLTGQFEFTNTGEAPLKITKVERCCGAVTKLDKNELAPGESGVLQVTYTSSRTAGTTSRRIYVNSNDKETPRAALTFKVETVLKVTYEPKSIKLLLKDEKVECPKITLTSTENKPFSITSFSATNDALTADFDGSVKAAKFVLEPKVDMDKLKNRSTGRITIGLAYSRPDTPDETVTIIFQALTRFSIRPSMLVVLYDKPAEPVKKSLTITNNYGEEFEVESTSIKEGNIKLLGQRKVGNSYQFELEITTPGEDVKRFSDTFTINLKDGQTLQVPCRGIYREPKQ